MDKGMHQEVNFGDQSKDQVNYQKVPPKPFTSVRDIGFMEEPNKKYRKKMEDGHVMIDKYRGNKHEGYFAVYDGHGGRDAVDYVQYTLHQYFEQELNKNLPVKDAYVKAYKRTDMDLSEKNILYNGTTSITCYVRLETDEKKQTIVKKLYTANCGDARVVISRNGVAKRLTYDHKASDPHEKKRITDTGGFVAYNRVNGILSVTRALGDHAMKEWVVCDPYYTELVLCKTDRLLILACDGVWDVLSDQEAVDLIKNDIDTCTAQQMSQTLLDTALERGSTDNISVMVILL